MIGVALMGFLMEKNNGGGLLFNCFLVLYRLEGEFLIRGGANFEICGVTRN